VSAAKSIASLCAMASREHEDDVTDPSSHTRHDCLNSQELKERMS